MLQDAHSAVLKQLGLTAVGKKRAIQSEKATRLLWIKKAAPWDVLVSDQPQLGCVGEGV